MKPIPRLKSSRALCNPKLEIEGSIPVYLIMFIATTLLARFDLLNSVFVGAIPVFQTRNMGLDAKTTWIIFGVTVVIALIILMLNSIAIIIISILRIILI